jgi:hypothetical protein
MTGVFGLRGWVRWRGGRGIAWKPRWDTLLFSQRLGFTRVYRLGPLYVWGLSHPAIGKSVEPAQGIGSATDTSSRSSVLVSRITREDETTTELTRSAGLDVPPSPQHAPTNRKA